MQAGTLRKRVTFQARSTATDSFGDQVTSWADVCTVYADIQPLSGRELFAAQAVQSAVSHSITVRYRPEFAVPKTVAAMRIVYNGRFFNIESSLNFEERNRLVTMQAVEGLNNG